MTQRFAIVIALIVTCVAAISAQKTTKIQNPAIDMKGFLKLANEAAKHRSSRRLSEEQFIQMSQEPGVVVLDARSRAKYDELHVRGAVNLSFPDITVESLATLLPDKNATILIYCNNNFFGADTPFPSKSPSASLNLSTYISLYTYGYRNVYELGPLLDARTTKLDLVPTEEPVAVR